MSFGVRFRASKHGRNIAILAFMTAAVVTACASEDLSDNGDPPPAGDAGKGRAADDGDAAHDAMDFDTSTPPGTDARDGATGGDDHAHSTRDAPEHARA